MTTMMLVVVVGVFRSLPVYSRPCYTCTLYICYTCNPYYTYVCASSACFSVTCIFPAVSHLYIQHTCVYVCRRCVPVVTCILPAVLHLYIIHTLHL